MKKVVLLITIVSLLIITASAPMAAESTGGNTIGLTAAINKALDYDKTDRIKDIEIRSKTTEAEDAVKNAQYPDREQEIYDQYKDLSIPAKEIWKEVIPLEKQFEVEKLNNEKKESDELLKNKVTNAYFNALLNIRNEELVKQELDLGKKDLEIAQNQYKLGLVSSMALNEAQLVYDKLGIKYASAVDDRDSGIEDIADLLGISSEACLLTPEKAAQMELPEYTKTNFVALIKKNDTAYLNAVKDQGFKQKRYDIYMEITRYGVGEEVAEAEKALLTANMALREVSKNEIIQMYSEYIDLQNTRDDIETARNNLKISEDKVKQKELQFEKGLATEQEVKKEQLNSSYAALSLDQLVNEFNLRTGNLMIKLN